MNFYMHVSFKNINQIYLYLIDSKISDKLRKVKYKDVIYSYFK